MPITLDDFKEGGSLRNFVTQVGLLGKIGKDGVNQKELLSTLINSVTMVGAYTDSNEDGAITTADSVSDKFSNEEEDKNAEGSENNEGGSTEGNDNEEGGKNDVLEGDDKEDGNDGKPADSNNDGGENNDGGKNNESNKKTEPQSPSVDPAGEPTDGE